MMEFRYIIRLMHRNGTKPLSQDILPQLPYTDVDYHTKKLIKYRLKMIFAIHIDRYKDIPLHNLPTADSMQT